MKIKLAVCQFDITEGAPEYNYRRAAEIVREAAGKGADMVLLPEMWPGGFDFSHIEEISQPFAGKATAELSQLAREEKIFLIGGSFAEKKKGGVYNTCPVFNEQGEVVNKYRKIHLFSHYLNEHLYLRPGEEWALTDFECEGERLVLGHMICYDLRFPELARNLALRGARLFLVPAGWPQARINEFEILCRARAIENRCFLACANYSDTENGEYCGNSLIIDPFGNILAKMDNTEGCALAEIDTELLKAERVFNSIADRRKFLDEIDDNQL
ncbi:MAG: hypothetical protein K6E41_09290 [Solobacterium sp.]|nr:hypothetical protein [Solobacterium sp.]